VGVHIVAHLYAGYALELLEQMRANDAWHCTGFLIGSLTDQLSSETVDGILTLENQIELASYQTQDVFDFLRHTRSP
jgi:hypothetical protein